jgi:hypothetical protein
VRLHVIHVIVSVNKMVESEEEYEETIKEIDSFFLENLKKGKSFEETEKEYKKQTMKARAKFEKEYQKQIRKIDILEKENKPKKEKEIVEKERKIKRVDLKPNEFKEKYYNELSRLYRFERRIRKIGRNKTALNLYFYWIKIKLILKSIIKDITIVLTNISDKLIKKKENIVSRVLDIILRIKEFIIKQINKIKFKKKNEEKGKDIVKEDKKEEENSKNKEDKDGK